MMLNVFKIIILLIPVILGGLIYIIFRTEKLIMFCWFDYLHLTSEINIAKSFRNTYAFPDWFIYSFPDGLWIFSYTAISLKIWKSSMNQNSFFWILSIPVASILSEFLQFLNIIPGTFDFTDLLFYLIGIVLPFLSKKNNY